MNNEPKFGPLRLAADQGEEVYEPHQQETKTVLDSASSPLIPIRAEVDLDLDPDFPLF